MLGFDIEIWLIALRGRTLVMLDRQEEARPFLDRILELESSQVDPFIMSCQAWRMWTQPGHRKTSGWLANMLTGHSPSRSKSGNPYLRGLCPSQPGSFPHRFGKAYFGYRGFIRSSALRPMSKGRPGKRTAHPGRSGKCLQTERDIQNSFSVVNEAIKVAIDRNARVPECLARIVHAKLLLSEPAIKRLPEARNWSAHRR